MVYLDKASTTKISNKVLKQIKKYNKKYYCNPSSSHDGGTSTNSLIEECKYNIIKQICCPYSENKSLIESKNIIFTSGATESNNMVFKGLKKYLKEQGKTHIITSSIEHKSVLKVCEELEKDGFSVTYLPVDKTGIVSIDEFKNSVTEKTGLVSIMSVNNEIGTYQPIRAISTFCKQNNILFHTDATQAIGHIITGADTDEVYENVDFISFSGHKFNALKGIGALIYSKEFNTIIKPIIVGGKQQNNIRAGTENVNGIISLNIALENKMKSISKNITKIKKIEKFLDKLLVWFITDENLQYETVGNLFDENLRYNGIKNVCFYYIDKDNVNEMLINGNNIASLLSRKKIYISTASACSNQMGSYVLKQIYKNTNDYLHCIRISFDETNSYLDIIRFVLCLKKIIK